MTMKIIDPYETITTTTKRGLSDEEFQSLLNEGVDNVEFVRTEGCIKITSDVLSNRIPESLRSDSDDQTMYSDRYIYFVTSEVDLYLIIGNRINDNGQTASWGALSSSEIFAICDDLGIENCFAGDTLNEKINEYKDFMTSLIGE